MDSSKFTRAEGWAQAHPAGPRGTRDAVLGWVGFIVIAVLVYLLFAGLPTKAERAEADARYEELQKVRRSNAVYACSQGVRAACAELGE